MAFGLISLFGLLCLEASAKDAAIEIAKTVKGNSKTKATGESSDSKEAFKKWFDAFFARLYYARDLAEVRPYYSSRFMKAYHRIPPNLRDAQLEKLKRQYIGKPKIAKVTLHPGGKTCDVKVEGTVSVYRRKGYGYGIFRMVKEDSIWRIDSAAHRGKAMLNRYFTFGMSFIFASV